MVIKADVRTGQVTKNLQITEVWESRGSCTWPHNHHLAPRPTALKGCLVLSVRAGLPSCTLRLCYVRQLVALLAVFGGYVGLLGSHVGTMFFPFCLYLTASEGYAGTFGTFGGYVGTMLGKQGALLVSFERYVGAIWGLCWATWKPCWTHLAKIGALLVLLCWAIWRLYWDIWRLCWDYVEQLGAPLVIFEGYAGPFEGYVGPLGSHVGTVIFEVYVAAFWGLYLAIWRLCWDYVGQLGALLTASGGLCRAIWRLCWDYVRQLVVLLAVFCMLCWAFWRLCGAI